MAIVSKESFSIRDNGSGQRHLSAELRAKITQARTTIERDEVEFKEQIIPCPIDKTPSRYLRDEGSYTRVHAIFRCEKGHEFPVG